MNKEDEDWIKQREALCNGEKEIRIYEEDRIKFNKFLRKTGSNYSY